MHSPGLDDSELLRRARVDADAFAAFYRRHAHAVYRSLLSDCGDPDVALDLTAETFARALQSTRALSRRARRLGPRLDLRDRELAAPAVRARAAHRGPRAPPPRHSRGDADRSRGRLGRRPRRRRGLARPACRRAARAAPEPAERAAPAHRGRGHVRGDRRRLGLLPGRGAPAGLARHAPAERAVPGGGRVSGDRAGAPRGARARARRRGRAPGAANGAGGVAGPSCWPPSPRRSTLAAAGSMAATGFFATTDRQLSALRDERLDGAPGGRHRDRRPAAGKRPRDATSGARGSSQGTA